MTPEPSTPTPIAPDRWQTVERLFHAALEQPTGERRSFLAQASRGDTTLHTQVASLLAALQGPEVFSEVAAQELATELEVPAAGPSSAAPFPERLGPYRLLEVLGEGGMSTVYLAEQSEPLPRRVALKLMRWGGMRGETLRRFELEREALARMNHPTIAQVFGAGATEHGQPYVVIEHVPGPPITDYCDAQRLSIEERLRLFTAVCHGVRHAHEKAVIHRDLKPSNILVAEVQGEAVPKIIDFGIAKSLEPWSDSAAQATRSQLRVGSPGYMSPEAIADGGRAVDTRSDVYSLGIVLCQLLIGVRPFEERQDLLFPTLGRPPASDPPRPSRRFAALPAEDRRRTAEHRGTSETRLLRSLSRELDWIVMRAIAHVPADRYGSAQELAADVEGWLAGQPVSARSPNVFYRARKAVRRHAVACLAGTLIFAILVGSSLRSNALYRRTEVARVQAEELVDFMLDDLSAQLEPIGRLDLLESVARRSLAYFESDRDGGLGEGGRRPAAALRQIGQVLASRGDLGAAREAYERALAIDRRLHRANPEDPLPRLDVAQDLALVGKIYQAQGELLRTGAASAEAQGQLRELRGELTDHPDARVALAKTLVQIASLRRSAGHKAESVALSQEALGMLEELRRLRPDNVEIRHALGEAHYGSGMTALHWLGDAQAAARAFEAGAAIFRTLATSEPEASLWRYRLAVLQGQGLATAYRITQRLDDAQVANLEALALYEDLVNEQTDNSRWAYGLGWELIRRGRLANLAGDPDAAAGAWRRSIEIQEALLARRTGQTDVNWLNGLATAHSELAALESRRGHLVTALDAAEAALALRRRIVEVSEDHAYDHTTLASAGVLVSELRWRGGDDGGSRRALAEARSTLTQIDGVEVEEPAVLEKLVATRQRLGELERELDS
ncbi:MAG: serine/threonine-protein kinase [Acidobacteriota bacterium]